MHKGMHHVNSLKDQYGQTNVQEIWQNSPFHTDYTPTYNTH